MCGRAAYSEVLMAVAEALGLPKDVPTKRMNQFQKSQNLSPGMSIPVAYCAGEGMASAEIGCMVWGLVPSFTKPEEKPQFFRLFNARSETVATKPIFKRLLSHRRCVVALDGYYEWILDEKNEKQPYFVHYSDKRPVLFAGLYDIAKRSSPSSSDNIESDFDRSQDLYTFTILTTDASPRLNWMHDRMPAVIPTDVAKMWLNSSVSAESVLPNINPFNSDDLAWYPVSKKINSVKYQEEDCTVPVLLDHTPSQSSKKSIADYFSPIKSQKNLHPIPKLSSPKKFLSPEKEKLQLVFTTEKEATIDLTDNAEVSLKRKISSDHERKDREEKRQSL